MQRTNSLQSQVLTRSCSCLVLCASVTLGTVAVGAESTGIKVPEGFRVTHYADDDLAHDIFSMTIDAKGRVVVSGPGYVRILIDSDGDGQADTFKQFADGPSAGAQGMFFLGSDLFCTGDGGLIRYRDEDSDDRADGPADVFLKLPTGGEHHAHAVRKGPDGWWYLVVGNSAKISAAYATLDTSPIKKPRAGTLIRLKPDLSGGEIVVDGFRNAYDFAFNAQGDLFTFDSDGERDVSLPWYVPTRVFHLLPSTDAGWVSRSWKRPDYFLNMPPVVGSFGRGSPAGVACYRHHQFPSQYDNALIALDWTFGRVMALPLARNRGTWKSEPIEFMKGTGQFGFAPTDVEVGPDGSLFVSVGGRGTRGSVYRVQYQGTAEDGAQQASLETEAVSKDALAGCLNASQPLSSWSRARWVPLARELGKKAFVGAALDGSRPATERIRAVEILTELFGGLDSETIVLLSKSRSAEVRARAVWSLGRVDAKAARVEERLPFLEDEDPLVLRCAWESLIGAPEKQITAGVRSKMVDSLDHEHRVVRHAAAHIVPKKDKPALAELTMAAKKRGARAVVALDFGKSVRGFSVLRPKLAVALRVLNSNGPRKLKLDALRLIQLALGDVGPKKGRPPVFDGYLPKRALDRFERDLDPARIQLAKLYPTGDAAVDVELGRALAMLTPYNPDLLDRVLAKIGKESSPIDDIHQLIVAACIPVARNAEQRAKTIEALIGLEPKIHRLGLNQDSNWNERITELYEVLVKHDPLLPEDIVLHDAFGQPGHVLFMSQVPGELLQKAVEAFVKRMEDDDEYAWTTDVVFVIGESTAPEHRELVRAQYDNFAVQSAVLMSLAEKPVEVDRAMFVEGLESSQVEVLSACLGALEKLPADNSATEQFGLLRLLRRLRAEKTEKPIRNQAVRLLRRNTEQDFGFDFAQEDQPQVDVINKWTDWLSERFPDEAAKQSSGSGDVLAELRERLGEVDWSHGDAARGAKLFEARACARCHGGRTALGPDLAGAARRFSREDMFVAMALPNRDVSPRYQSSLITTVDGITYSGLIIYQSVDGLLMRNSTNQTFRIEASDIEFRRKLNTSLMPSGLLKDLKADELADLYAYLSGLSEVQPKTAAKGAE